MAKKRVMNKRRLLKLADLLEENARNKKGMQFDINFVGKASSFEAGYTVGVNCGTTGCAMGLAAISGAFKRAGLSYRIDDGWNSARWIDTKWKGRILDFDHAAMRLFGIDNAMATFLFTPSYYPYGKRRGAAAERFVAKRIRKLVAGKLDIQKEKEAVERANALKYNS